MNWEKLFATHILERGYNYYRDNAVKNISISENLIQADVCGTEDYEVAIELNKEKITHMYCSCPYAADGEYCKHMAAVLYEWDSEKSQSCDCEEMLFKPFETKDNYNKKNEAVTKLVSKADEKTVKDFLATVLTEDDKLLLRFKSKIKNNTENIDITLYTKQVKSIVKHYQGRHKFIDYYSAGGFTDELYEILNNDIRIMIDNGHYMSAFKIINYIFLTLGDVDMDDSDGNISFLADSIYELWLEILELVNEKEKEKMYLWYVEHLNGKVIDFLEDVIEMTIFNGFNEEKYTEKKLSLIKTRLDELKKQDDRRSNDYSIGKWVLRYLDIISSQKGMERETESLCATYWENSSVRKFYIDRCIKNKNYNRALEVLDESIALDSGYAGLIFEYKKKKKEIFLLQGNKEAYINQLTELVIERGAGNMELYNELKKQYTAEEWSEKREYIFNNLSPYSGIDRFYKEEKLYNRLLEYVMKSPGLYSLTEYASILKKDYPEKLLEKYKTELEKEASYANGRSHYKRLVTILRSMKKIKGGSKAVDEIVMLWKEKYRSRPAMLDELGKL